MKTAIQAEQLRRHDADHTVEHFTELLDGFDEPTRLPYESYTSKVQGESSDGRGEVSTWLTPEQLNALKQSAAAAKVAPATVLALCWGALLARYAGSDDVVFGVSWPNGSLAEAEARRAIGPLPVRVMLSSAATPRLALVELQAQLDALGPLEQGLSARIPVASELGEGSPLFRSSLVLSAAPLSTTLEPWDLAGLERDLSVRHPAASSLVVGALVEQDRLRITIAYDRACYVAPTAQSLVENCRSLLVQLCSLLDENLHALRMLDADLYRRLTEEQAALEEVDPEPSALSCIMAIAEQKPNAIAVEDMGGASVSYGELKERVQSLASLLAQQGVGPGEIVGVMMQRSIDAMVAILAIHTTGSAFLPLDPAQPEQRLEYMLEDSQARLVLVNDETEGLLTSAADLKFTVPRVYPPVTTVDLPTDPTPAASLAYVIYTSGSTGKPKGVSIPHGALANHVKGTLDLFELRPEDRVLQFASLSFDACIEEIFPTLAAGATLIIRSEQMSSSARLFFEGIESCRATILDLPTAFWHQLVHSELPWPKCVRLLVVGGERVSAPAHTAFRATDTSHIRFINTYGPTETTVTSTVYDDSARDHDAGDVPIGKPAHGLSHFVLDQHMRPVPPGAVGQLYIGGVGLALGYLRRPELTDERFVHHPWRPGARLYKTGDLVRQTERGHYLYVDRIDHQVKIRGFRVELGEIEACLRAHPAVNDAVVVVQQESGQAARLLAFAAADKTQTSAKELRQHLADTLPPYMVPAHLCIETELPKTPSNKIDRRALAQRMIVTEPVNAELVTDNALERELLIIWSELLKVPVTDTQANFFDLGGNSLLAVQMFTNVEKRLGRTCNVAEFFKTGTLAALRALIENHDGSDWNSPCLHLAQGKAGALPLFLTPSVTGRAIDYVHLADRLGEHRPIYALQMRGLREGDAVQTNLVEAASDYVRLMREVQPAGPYAIAGFSAGGTIALAIAEVLYERGERVAFLGLLDADPAVPILSPFTSLSRFRRLARTTAARLQELWQGPDIAKRLWIRSRSAISRGAARFLPFHLAYEAKVDGLFVGAGVELTEEESIRMQAHLDAIIAHEPKRYPIDAVLFRTHLDPFEGPHEPDLGWSRAISGSITIDILPCMHHELLTREGAPRLADLMNPYLSALPELAASS